MSKHYSVSLFETRRFDYEVQAESLENAIVMAQEFQAGEHARLPKDNPGVLVEKFTAAGEGSNEGARIVLTPAPTWAPAAPPAEKLP